MNRTISIIAAAAALVAATPAHADDPKFEYGKQEDTKKVIWKASVTAGLILNTGNSNNVSFAAAGNASRNDGKNKITLDVGGAYARSTIFGATDAAKMAGVIASQDDIKATDQTTTALWNIKFRYDRFLTPNNILYAFAFANGNEPAGKKVWAGAQVGYARQLYKSQRHILQLEAGIDYTFQRQVVTAVPDYHLVSLRVFLGYGLTFSETVGFTAGIEYLGNMNPFKGPPFDPNVSSFEDSRVNAQVALNAKLYKWLSFRFGFKVLFDNVPAARPPLDVPYAPGFFPAAQKVDTITDASLVFTIL